MPGDGAILGPTPSHKAPDAPGWSPFRSVWSKLVALSLGLVVIPGAVFGVLVSSRATAALERAVGRQLASVAGDGAQSLSVVIAGHRARLESWTRQELMREVIVADVDKRISRFLLSQQIGTPMLLEALVTDFEGTVVAATDPAALETRPGRDQLHARIGPEHVGVAVVGPRASVRHGRTVLELAMAIPDPENPTTSIGTLTAIYDWRFADAVLAPIRKDVRSLGIDTDLLILDASGTLIGGSWTSRLPLTLGRNLHEAGWRTATFDAPRYDVEPQVDALVGRAALVEPAPPWSVLVVQPRTSALAPVAAMNRQLMLILAVVVFLGLAIASVLAHRIVRPLRLLTQATHELARAGATLEAVPVRSRDEVGELTAAFNRMAADLRRAHDDLVATARLATLGEIAAGIAHEVRTPLGIMRGSAQMLGRSLDAGNAQQTELIDMIVGEVDRLERVVGGLIELAKPRPPAIEATALEPLLARAAEFVAGQAGAAGVAVRVSPANRSCAAQCDGEQIYQVVLNLLVNALQAQPGGGEVRLRTLAGDNGRVGFEISDDGPGIPTEAQPHVFSPFFTKREGGTGLGLAMVERIVRAHEGTVTMTSIPGEGATFRVELPKAVAA